MRQKNINLDGKKILITGSSGFVGSVLLRKILSDFPKAKLALVLRKSAKTWRINDILKQLSVIEGDLVDKTSLAKVADFEPNIIFHLAAYGAYPVQNSLEESIKINVIGLQNLLLTLEKINYQVFVNTGSSSEYGYKNNPMKETDLLEPASYYAATKAAATHIASVYGKINRKPVVTLRLFSVYGKYEDPGRFVPTAIINALKGEKIDVVGGGQARDFILVDDVVDAYFACTRLDNFKHRVFNIASGNQHKIENTARIIKQLTKSQSNLNIGGYDPRSWDTNFWVGDNTLAKEILDWIPKHTLEEGLIESISWFRENIRYYEEK